MTTILLILRIYSYLVNGNFKGELDVAQVPRAGEIGGNTEDDFSCGYHLKLKPAAVA